MIAVKIEGSEYSLKDDWDDITLREFQDICRLSVPSKLKERYVALLSGDTAKYDQIKDTYREVVKTHPKFYGEVIRLLSNIPKEVIDRIEWSVRTRLYSEYLLPFVETTLAPLPLEARDGKIEYYKPVGAKAFSLNGETFYFPESLMYGGREIPMAKEKIVTFAEASDIQIALHEWGEQGIDAMAQVCAVYLRKEGEQHTDELVLQRMEQFKDLPMSVVWEVFFCTTELGLRYASDLQAFSQEAAPRAVMQLERVVSQALQPED